MIYLSQLILNPASRMVQSECRNPYEMHRTLLRGFGSKRTDAHVLHRLDIHPDSGDLTLLVQSTVEPNWQPLTEAGQGQYLLAPPRCKLVDLNLRPGHILHFRLTANPAIKKVRRDEQGERKNSNRVPLVHEDQQVDWLKKQAAQHGFCILDVQVTQPTKQTARKKDITLFTVQYNGHLQITDAEKFRTAIRTGIGPAKAFGCGLLSLAPARG